MTTRLTITFDVAEDPDTAYDRADAWVAGSDAFLDLDATLVGIATETIREDLGGRVKK